MKSRSPEEYRRGLDQILDDNQRVEELVGHMLTLARFDDRASVPSADTDLGRETTAAVNTLATYAEWRDITVRVDAAPGIKVPLTPEAASTLVSNLLLNAVQHSAHGAEVEVRVQREQGAGDQAILIVQDFGEGIAAENLSRVFERFFREDPSRSRETGGAGLGLSICKSIVERAGGTIEIQSQKGSGTAVRVAFDLPAGSRLSQRPRIPPGSDAV